MSENKYYKYCIVPKCGNTSVKTPNKRFITMPRDLERRALWQKAMRRVHLFSVRSVKFVCEDHFNLEEDLENYLYIKIMKSGKMRLKPHVVPHIFECQGNRSDETVLKPTLTSSVKLQNKELVSTLLTLEDTSLNSEKEDSHILVESEINLLLEPTIIDVNQDNKYIQVNLTPLRKSVGIQCCILEDNDFKRPKRNASIVV